jgi:hypothetical protein
MHDRRIEVRSNSKNRPARIERPDWSRSGHERKGGWVRFLFTGRTAQLWKTGATLGDLTPLSGEVGDASFSGSCHTQLSDSWRLAPPGASGRWSAILTPGSRFLLFTEYIRSPVLQMTAARLTPPFSSRSSLRSQQRRLAPGAALGVHHLLGWNIEARGTRLEEPGSRPCATARSPIRRHWHWC